MNRSARLSWIVFVVTAAFMYSGLNRITHAQDEAKQPAKFTDPDSPATKGTYKSKLTGGALESVTFATANVAHGRYVYTSRPPCQNTDGATATNWSSCSLVVAHLPANATVDGVAGFAREVGQTNYSPCYSPAQDCAIGWSTFVDNYQVNNTANEVLVMWTISNWSDNRDRQALIVVNSH